MELTNENFSILISYLKSIDDKLKSFEEFKNSIHITKKGRIGVASIPVFVGKEAKLANRFLDAMEEFIAIKQSSQELTN
jgi:hypothetical protein